MFISGMVLKPGLSTGPVTADLTTIVVHRHKSLINDVKPVHSLTHLRKLFSTGKNAVRLVL